MNKLAQGIPVPIEPPSNAIAVDGSGGATFASIISTTIGAMTIIAAIWFLFKIILGGIAIINSDGDPQKVSDARGSITFGVIGIVVVISAVFMVGILEFIFGIKLLNISAFLDNA